MIQKSLNLDDLEGQYCNGNCISCSMSSLSTAELSCCAYYRQHTWVKKWDFEVSYNKMESCIYRVSWRNNSLRGKNRDYSGQMAVKRQARPAAQRLRALRAVTPIHWAHCLWASMGVQWHHSPVHSSMLARPVLFPWLSRLLLLRKWAFLCLSVSLVVVVVVLLVDIVILIVD